MKQKSILLMTWIWWSLGGVSLLTRGFFFGQGEQLSLCFLIGLFIGTLKYFFVIRNSASRLIKYIRSNPIPIRVKNIYPKKFYLLIGIMVVIAICIRYVPLLDRDRAIVYFAIGIALINGGTDFLKEAMFPKKVVFK